MWNRPYKHHKESNRIYTPKEYIARKKRKSSEQTHKGTKKDNKYLFRPGGMFYVN